MADKSQKSNALVLVITIAVGRFMGWRVISRELVGVFDLSGRRSAY